MSGVADGVGSIALNSQVESVGLSAEYHNGAADWITDTQIVGNDLTFAYLKNETAFPRFASIVITYKDAAGVSLKHRFDVLQSNSADSLQPSEDAFSDLTKDGKCNIINVRELKGEKHGALYSRRYVVCGVLFSCRARGKCA